VLGRAEAIWQWIYGSGLESDAALPIASRRPCRALMAAAMRLTVRKSELAELRFGDLRERPDGALHVFVAQSKFDQLGVGADLQPDDRGPARRYVIAASSPRRALSPLYSSHVSRSAPSGP